MVILRISKKVTSERETKETSECDWALKGLYWKIKHN